MKHRILEAMEGANLKPLQLAKAMGVSSGAVTHWLNGDVKTLKAVTAAKMQQVTGYSSDWILYGKGPKRPGGAAATPIEYTGPTPIARKLALVFDMIPEDDHSKRSKAYLLAEAAIAAVLQGDEITQTVEPRLKK